MGWARTIWLVAAIALLAFASITESEGGTWMPLLLAYTSGAIVGAVVLLAIVPQPMGWNDACDAITKRLSEEAERQPSGGRWMGLQIAIGVITEMRRSS